MHDATWTQRLAENPPRLLIVSGAGGEPIGVSWEKIELGRFAARIAIPPGGWLRGVVSAGSERWPFGPISTGVDPEWTLSAVRIRELQEVSRLSGGREITDLRHAWQPPREQQFAGIGAWLLGGLLLLFLAEVAATRARNAA
jgi:hypothetical protein